MNFLDFEQPIAELEAKIDVWTQFERKIGRRKCKLELATNAWR